jgi:hypothetical protein
MTCNTKLNHVDNMFWQLSGHLTLVFVDSLVTHHGANWLATCHDHMCARRSVILMLSSKTWCNFNIYYNATKGLFTLEVLGHGLYNIMVPHLLDETMGKPMGHGSKGFCSLCKPNLDQDMHFFNKRIFC